MGTSESEGVTMKNSLRHRRVSKLADPDHRCSDALEVVETALSVSMSQNIMLDAVACGMLKELGKAGWCIIRTEDL